MSLSLDLVGRGSSAGTENLFGTDFHAAFRDAVKAQLTQGGPPDENSGAGDAGDAGDAGGVANPFSNDPDKDKGKDKVDVSGLYGSSGKDIVSQLEAAGHLKFQGPNADKLRDALIDGLDKSPTFKRLYLDGFTSTPAHIITYQFNDDRKDTGAETGSGGPDTAAVVVGAGTLDNPKRFKEVVAHESLHASTGVKDSVAIAQEMTSFFDEVSGDKDGSKANGNFKTGDLDYDLMQATEDDWGDAGALQQRSSYDGYSTPKEQEALESVMGHPGPYSKDDVEKAYTNSCQSFANDPQKIFQAYLDAKDGGKVEAMRAKQLEDLGYDVEALKKDPDKARKDFHDARMSGGHDHDLNEIAGAYHDFFTADDGKQMKARQVELTDKIQQAYGRLVDDYMAEHPGVSKDKAAHAILEEVKARTSATFPTGDLTPDGKDNTIVDQNDNGAYVRGLLDNWFDKHGGKDYIKAAA